MNIRSFTKTYSGRKVLNFPGIELQNGRIYAVIGANGSGKSTLAGSMADTIRPDDRKKLINGINVGFLPQKSYAFRMSTKNNLLLNARKDIAAYNSGSRADELLKKLGIAGLS